MPHSDSDGPLSKRQKLNVAAKDVATSEQASRIFAPFRAWMTVFLRLHFDVVMENEASLAALQEWKVMQESDTVDS
ncbi:hypothetical protein HYQ46_013352 [Verticillium longisporum]|nr:hypothetical protein HYQ46_013352 [Verticillium longisporum]